MSPLLGQKDSELERLCRHYFVERLELFGSATTDAFDVPRSDLDFLVRFQPSAPMPLTDQYFGFAEALTALFGRKVDLVMEGALKNPYFIASVNETRKLLYANSVIHRA